MNNVLSVEETVTLNDVLNTRSNRNLYGKKVLLFMYQNSIKFAHSGKRRKSDITIEKFCARTNLPKSYVRISNVIVLENRVHEALNYPWAISTFYSSEITGHYRGNRVTNRRRPTNLSVSGDRIIVTINEETVNV